MKLLFDESMPRPLALRFPSEFEVRTVQSMGWAGASNGDLLRLAATEEFDASVTVDRSIEYQQDLGALPIPVVVMISSRTRVSELEPLVQAVVNVLMGDLERRVYRVTE